MNHNNLIMNKYIVYDKIIGNGSFSKIYFGKNYITKENIAIKHIILTKENYEMINREINIMKQINHINIIKYNDFLKNKNNVYIFLEYCELGDLHKLIYNINLTETQCKDIFIQIKNAIRYLKDINIIHRDLKPHNILLKPDYTVKLCDFGFANHTNDINNNFCGSPSYMAPEILNCLKYTDKSELWSLGIILYEMLFRKYPYTESNSIRELIINLNNFKYKHFNYISDSCNDLLKKLLIINYDKRISWINFFNHNWVTLFSNNNKKIYNKIICQSPLMYKFNDNENKSMILSKIKFKPNIKNKDNLILGSEIINNYFEVKNKMKNIKQGILPIPIVNNNFYNNLETNLSKMYNIIYNTI